jgi:recombination protein RecA
MMARIKKKKDEDKPKKEIKQRSGSAGVKKALDEVKKKYGVESIRVYSEGNISNISVIPTGSIKLNRATGIGGVPRGRVVEIFGPESAGKTTLALQIIAASQEMGGAAGFIDAEHALDPLLATGTGVNMDDLILSQPDNGEQALEITEMLVRSSEFDVLAIDSVAALVPRAEIEGEMGDSHMGLQARLMSQALRKLTGAVAQSNTCVIFINQIRHKIGVVFGNPETTSGGNALKFYASMRLEIRVTGKVKKGDETIGNEVNVKVVKNKLASPFKVAKTELIFGRGFNMEGELIDMAMEYGIIEKSGSWYSYGSERLGQGKTSVCQALIENRDLFEQILGDFSVAEASGESEWS